MTRIVADELRGRLPVISSIVCEGLREAREHAEMARDAGAMALDVMPPHHWLRFGFRPGHDTEYFEAISKVSLDDIKKVAAEYLDMRHSVTGYLLPDKAGIAQHGEPAAPAPSNSVLR